MEWHPSGDLLEIAVLAALILLGIVLVAVAGVIILAGIDIWMQMKS